MNRARRPGAGSDFRKAAKLAARSQTDGEGNDSRMMRFVAGEKMSERLIVCAELLLCEELARLLGSVRSGQGRNHVGSFQERFQLGTEAGDRYEGRHAYTAAPAGDATPHSDDIGCSAVGSTSADRGRNEAFAYSRAFRARHRAVAAGTQFCAAGRPHQATVGFHARGNAGIAIAQLQINYGELR